MELVKAVEGAHLLLSSLPLLVQLSDLLSQTLHRVLVGIHRVFKLGP